MFLIARAVIVIVLLAIAGFCLFGFLATFEPIAPAAQLTWRVIYGTVGLACVTGAGWLIFARKMPPGNGSSQG